MKFLKLASKALAISAFVLVAFAILPFINLYEEEV